MLNDNVVDRRQDKLDLRCVCRAREVYVDLLLRILIEGLETMAEVLAAALQIAWHAVKVGEVVDDVGVSNLGLEEIDFVEEEDDGGAHKPSRIAY